MSAQLDDHDAIAEVIQLYIDGAAGDVAKLKRAFHPDARMFGHIDSLAHAIPISGFFEMVAGAQGQPMAGPNYKARIGSIQQTGDAAVAALVEQDYLGCDFVDYFSLARIQGRWQIVNKTYAHTGGKLPG